MNAEKSDVCVINLNDVSRAIENIKAEVLKLKERSGGMQCIVRNCERILASLAMIEINCETVSAEGTEIDEQEACCG